MIEALIGIVAAAAGAAMKALWDSYIKRRDTIELEIWKIRVSQVEKQLSLFYWPIYLRLQRDNVVWTRILDRFKSAAKPEEAQLAYQVDAGVLLPNHLEIIKIIESHVHLAKLDTALEGALMAYVRHVDVYRSLRAAGIKDKDPIMFGEPFPREFFALVQQRLLHVQADYDELLQLRGVP